MDNKKECKINASYSLKPQRSIPLSRPFGICYDEINELIVASSLHHIEIFNYQTLECDLKFGDHGSAPGQFNYPTGLCVQPFTRNLLICNSFNNHVQAFTIEKDPYTCSFSYQIGSTTGNESEEMGQFNNPRGICCDEKGHIIVADTWNHRIQEFNENGRHLHSFGCKGSSFDQFNDPWGICFDKEHHQLLITDYVNKRVSIWSHDSSSKPQPISRIEFNASCFSVCTDPLRNHQIVVGTRINILVYDNRNHKLLQTFSRYDSKFCDFDLVTGLCVNEDDGSLIVVDCRSDRIQIF